MTAEIGTMRVTEQIDALETLAYDPIAFLAVPRVLAALVMLPTLTMLANVAATARYHLLGFDPRQTTIPDRLGRPMHLTEGTFVRDLLA